MSLPRHVKQPIPIAIPRHEVNTSIHQNVDATLKAARICAQQVAPLEACLKDEMRILERLYYKSINQHRMAHFWKRVQEVRRLGRRVLEAHFTSLLDDLRFSFYVKEGSERKCVLSTLPPTSCLK